MAGAMHADPHSHVVWLYGWAATLFRAAQQKNMNVYATAHLSGDVANAVTLLKRMTRPSSRKHKAGLLIPSADLAACQVPLPPWRPSCGHQRDHWTSWKTLSGWLYLGQELAVNRMGFPKLAFQMSKGLGSQA